MKGSYKNLSEFIAALEAAGEVKTIDTPVSHFLEISKYTDRESKSPDGGKALLFKNVTGADFPAATNLFGSNRRICMAMGVDNLDELGVRVRGMIDMSPPESFKEMLALLPAAISVTRFFPKKSRAKTPPCQQVVYTGDDINLFKLPVLYCWPQDAGRFITLPLVITRSLKTGKRNMGMYRLQVFDRNTTGMHWHVHKDGSHYYSEYCEAGKRMPVAVAIGADPATIYSATAPLPRNVDELILAGFIRGKSVPMARCVTVDLEVPAESEFVLEGYVDPGELRREGPFGDHTGYYSLADDYPVFHVTAITHRKNPIYCATLVGRPPMEDCYLAKATERLFLPLLQTAFPEIVDYWLPWEGVFHNIVVTTIDKAYPGHAHKVMHGLWGQGQMSFCKAIVVVDKDVKLTQPADIMQALLENLDIQSDFSHTKGVLDVLDHSSPIANFGNKLGIDLTRRVGGEPPRKLFPDVVKRPDAQPDKSVKFNIQQQIDGVINARCFPEDKAMTDDIRNRLLFLAVDRDSGQSGRSYAEKIAALELLKGFNVVILYDRQLDLDDDSLILWKLFNNVDPGRDIHLLNNRLIVDACMKRPQDGHYREWPDELAFDI